ncbi:MAG: choice-of-anchor D domain-containing protein, partial [Myxococcota bacterium]
MRGSFHALSLLLVTIACLGLQGCGGDNFETRPGGPDAGTDAAQDAPSMETGVEAGADAESDAEVGSDVLQPPDVVIDPVSRDFPLTAVGAQSPPADFVVTNRGDQASSALGVVLAGADAEQFEIVDDACAGVMLASDDTCTITVRFAPANPGPQEASLQVMAGTDVTESKLTGRGGRPPQLVIDPMGSAFGDIAVGSESAPRLFTVRNDGDIETQELAVEFDPVATADFRIVADHCSGSALASAATCNIEVAFTPTQELELTARLEVGTPSGLSVFAELAGTGIPASSFVLSPSPATLEPAVVDTLGNPKAFTLTNNGAASHGPVELSLAGADAAEFALNATGCHGFILAPGEACAVQVRLKATSAGIKTAELVAEAPNVVQAVASLSAEALEPARLVIQPSVQNFGTVGVGSSSNPYTFLVSNTGDEPSGDVSSQMQGTNAQDFSIDPNESTCTGSLEPGASCKYVVFFSPSALGTRAATLQVFSSPGGTVQAQLSGEGGDAQLSIDPLSHDFVDAIGSSVTFAVTNNGAVDTGVPQVAIQGVDAAEFTIDGNGCAFALGAGASCSVQVSFHPSSPGSKSASLQVSASPGGTVVAPLTGTNPEAAMLEVSPTNHDFGPVVVNGQASKEFTVTNAGEQDSSDVSVEVTGDAAFSLGASSCSGALSPATSCTVQVLFNPGAEGAVSGNLAVSASPGGTLTVPVSGTGTTGAALAISPQAMDFGVVVENETSAAEPFVVTNTGGQDSGAITVTVGAEFQLISNGCTGQTLAPSGQCTVTVAFAPTTAGDHTAVLTAAANPGGSASASLSGTGVEPAQLQLSPLSHDFGPVPDGTTSVQASFLVENIGSAPTSAINTQLLGSHAGQFSQQATPTPCDNVQLQPGGTCTVEVLFSPVGTGDRTASLQVSATEGGTVSASLTGEGVEPASLVISPAAYDFPAVPMGQSATTTFTVTNQGGASSGLVDVSAPAYPFDVPVAGDGCSGTSLGPAEQCTFQVTFHPFEGGLYADTVTVGADPGGPVLASVSGGTADIFVSTSGVNTNDGRSWATAVKTITRGLELAQTNWTVHVEGGSYGNGESYPLALPAGVTVLGDPQFFPVLTPTLMGSAPAQLFVMNNAETVLKYFEVHSNASITNVQALVTMQGEGALLEDCILKCAAAH